MRSAVCLKTTNLIMSDFLPSFLTIVFNNIVGSALLAVVAWGASRVCKNQYVVHFLWLIVIAKLLAPPLWKVPLPGQLFSTADHFNVRRQGVGAELKEFNGNPLTSGSELFVSSQEGQSESAFLAESVESNEGLDFGAALPIESSPIGLRPSWPIREVYQSALAGVWLACAVGMGVLMIGRIRKFSQLIAEQGEESAPLSDRVDELAEQLSITSAPDVRLVRANISPMVWPLSRRPLLLLPAELTEELTPAQLDTVIAHELGHIARRDAWVRVLESVVVCFFWWFPIVWCARRRLRDAEENCCDAFVVNKLPSLRRQYGEALLHIAERVSGCPRVPSIASGLGSGEALKDRITSILGRRMTGSASRWLRLSLCGIALTVLPCAGTTILPTGQDTQEDSPNIESYRNLKTQTKDPEMNILTPKALGTVAAVTALAAVSDNTVAEAIKEHHELAAKSGGRLRFESVIGGVKIETHKKDMVIYDVEWQPGKGGERQFADLMDRLEYVGTSDKGDVSIAVKWKSGKRPRKVNLKASHVIRIPASYHVDVKTSGGGIIAGALGGDAKVRTSGGGIVLGNVHGDLDAGTSGGGIVVGDVKGDAHIGTSGGGIKSGNVRGDVAAGTFGGSISLGGVGGHLTAGTSGGSIAAELLTQAQEPMNIATSGGSISLKVPADFKADLTAKTSGGSVSVGLPFSGNKRKNSATGKINGGGPKLSVNTSGGSISIFKG